MDNTSIYIPSSGYLERILLLPGLQYKSSVEREIRSRSGNDYFVCYNKLAGLILCSLFIFYTTCVVKYHTNNTKIFS